MKGEKRNSSIRAAEYGRGQGETVQIEVRLDLDSHRQAGRDRTENRTGRRTRLFIKETRYCIVFRAGMGNVTVMMAPPF